MPKHLKDVLSLEMAEIQEETNSTKEILAKMVTDMRFVTRKQVPGKSTTEQHGLNHPISSTCLQNSPLQLSDISNYLTRPLFKLLSKRPISLISQKKARVHLTHRNAVLQGQRQYQNLVTRLLTEKPGALSSHQGIAVPVWCCPLQSWLREPGGIQGIVWMFAAMSHLLFFSGDSRVLAGTAKLSSKSPALFKGQPGTPGSIIF